MTHTAVYVPAERDPDEPAAWVCQECGAILAGHQLDRHATREHGAVVMETWLSAAAYWRGVGAKLPPI